MRVVTDLDTSLWLLADLSGCATCEQPLTVHPAGRDRRFYLCPRCQSLHPADPLERGVVAAVMERDWILAQPADGRAVVVRWSNATRRRVRAHLCRLLAAAMVAPASDHATLYWTAEAIIDARSPWLGLWSGPAPAGPRPTRLHR